MIKRKLFPLSRYNSLAVSGEFSQFFDRMGKKFFLGVVGSSRTNGYPPFGHLIQQYNNDGFKVRYFNTSKDKADPSKLRKAAKAAATVCIGMTGLTFGIFQYWKKRHFSAQCSSMKAACGDSMNSNSSDSLPQEKSMPHDETGNGAAEFFVERNANQFQIFSGTSNPELAREICSHLGMPLGRIKIGRFADGEVTLEVLDEVRGKDCFVLQSAPSASSNNSPQSSLMELCFLIAALKRASAKRVTAVLPYMSYFRQTNQMDQAKPLAAADMGRILITMGVDRVIFVDVHSKRAEGFFPDPIPITNLQPQSLAIEYFKRKQELGKSVVIVSTDNTGTEKAQAFMSRMQQTGFDAGVATLVSNRPERPQKEAGAIILDSKTDFGVVCRSSTHNGPDPKKTEDWLVGDVSGRDCIIVDDIIDTGERAVNAAYALKSAGARRIYMFATHGLFSRGAIDRIVKSPIREVIVTDTIRIPELRITRKKPIIVDSLNVVLDFCETIRSDTTSGALYKICGSRVMVQRHSKRHYKKQNYWKWVPIEFPFLTFATFVPVAILTFLANTNYVAQDLISFHVSLFQFFLIVLGIRIAETAGMYFWSNSKKCSEDDQAMWMLQTFLIGLPVVFAFRDTYKRHIPVKLA